MGSNRSPASQVIRDTSSRERKGPHPPSSSSREVSVRPSELPPLSSTGRPGRGLTHSVQLPPQALLSHDGAGEGREKRGSPSSSICGPFLPPPLPLGCLTLKANAAAHPEAPVDVTQPDPNAFIKERGCFWTGGEDANSSLSMLSPSLPFHVLHSCALTEAGHRREFCSAVTNSTDVGVREAGGANDYIPWCWLDGTDPCCAMLCLQSGLSPCSF